MRSLSICCLYMMYSEVHHELWDRVEAGLRFTCNERNTEADQTDSASSSSSSSSSSPSPSTSSSFHPAVPAPAPASAPSPSSFSSSSSVRRAVPFGIARWNVMIDPGIGFAKMPQQSVTEHSTQLSTIQTSITYSTLLMNEG